jgi:uncharacterized protein (UPF0335 family)
MTDSNIAPTLQSFESRMTNLVSEAMRVSADLRELNKEIASAGLSHRALKRIVKAKLAADDGNSKPLEALREDVTDLSIYLDTLAPAAESEAA